MRNYATPRHFAAAALKSKHPDPIALAALRLFPFQWVDAEEGSGVTSDLAALGVLSLWGFPVRLDLTDQARNLGEIRTAYQKHLTWRDEQSFAADGIVAKLDDLSLRRRLGEGARAPFWAAAWKFPPETAQTLVREIRWNSGRTGRRTPVAELVPVSLGGVRVSRVSLSNAETVRRLGIAAGDQVLIGLVADIIPQVLEVKKKAGRTDGSDTTPAEAPESGMTDCLSDAAGCREQFLARAVHFTSKAGLNVAGLGPGRLRKLVEAGLVRDLPSLFRLKREEVAALTGFNAASARSLTAALRRVGRPEPFRLLAALGVPGIGPATAQRLSKQFQSLDELLLSQNDLTDGSMAVQNIHRFFETQQGRELLRGLREVDLL
jgi:DNA ligase (NAD+)